MFQFGQDFSVPTSKNDVISPVFNGHIDPLRSLLKKYNDSYLIDQDCFWNSLYIWQTSAPSFRKALACFCNYGQDATELLAEDRIRLIPDMNNWRGFLIEQGYNYAFGTRIHGNIMAILSGVPATVAAVDTRTREMAEFFDIPYVLHVPGHVYSADEFIDFYNQADYTKFNASYKEKYEEYCHFLIDNRIVSKVNGYNRFFSEQEYSAPLNTVNREYYKTIAQLVESNIYLFKIARAAINVRNSIVRK